jgi:hypothetical protein
MFELVKREGKKNKKRDENRVEEKLGKPAILL